MSDVETEMAHVRSHPSDYADVPEQKYDPNFISDISQKMQVPERICLDDGSGAAENTAYYDPGSGRQASIMNVPDRIIVAGGNQHIGMREALRKLPMDRDPHMDAHNMVELATPPRVLTLEQRFPVVEGNEEKKPNTNEAKQVSAPGCLAAPVPYTPGLSPNDSLLVNDEDEGTLLRTQVAKLVRRVTVLEQENMRRAQREMGLYIALFGYLITKVVSSFFRSR